MRARAHEGREQLLKVVIRLCQPWQTIVNFDDVYNPVCFSKSAHTFKQSYGGVFDVRYGLDFSNAGIRDWCWAMFKELSPTLIIGSPLCVSTPMDALRAGDLDAAWSHLQF